jgi:hypothetical protein
MLKKAVQQDRSKRRGERGTLRYVELLSEARTPLADFFSILLDLAYEYSPSELALSRSVAGLVVDGIVVTEALPYSLSFFV